MKFKLLIKAQSNLINKKFKAKPILPHPNHFEKYLETRKNSLFELARNFYVVRYPLKCFKQTKKKQDLLTLFSDDFSSSDRQSPLIVEVS